MDPSVLADTIKQPNLIPLIRDFLRHQLHPTFNSSDSDSSASSLPPLPFFNARISTYASAVATFHAPSDICGTGGMRRERIRAVPSWRRGPGRYDCLFVKSDPDQKGMLGLDVARARLFFSFTFRGKFYPCVLVHWYSRVYDHPDEDTGMWIIKRDRSDDGALSASVLHLDSVLRAAHLIGVYGDGLLQRGLSPLLSLDIFNSYYVNKFIDHHCFEIAC